jgi:hypothetical protein
MEAVGSRKIGQESAVIRATRAVSDGLETRTYARGRTCRAPGCSTVLSIYNGSRLCWQHEPIRPFILRAPHPGRRGRKGEEAREPRRLDALLDA